MRKRDEDDGIRWDEAMPPPPRKYDAGSLADALVEICAEYLAGRAAHADNPDTYQVIIHAGAGAITAPAERQAPEAQAPGPQADRVSAETSSAKALATLKETIPLLTFPVGHAAYPERCHIENGPAISLAMLQMIACSATISTMLHDTGGNVLNVGRRSRKASPALRRAARERDRYRCRFPGCESRRVDLHHILFWANGGETKLANIICLCKRHHRLVHDKDIIIATLSDGAFAFYLSNGTLIPSSPPLPSSTEGTITACHDATITPATIIPPHSGERLDLSMAIWICFANAKNRASSAPREPAVAGAPVT
jgi:hypothetical protein